MIIRVVLITILILLLGWYLAQRVTNTAQAWTKIIAVSVFILAIVSIISPGITDDIAHTVGVGRGADLLLYSMTIVFICYAVIQYAHNRDKNTQFAQLVRRIALIEAENNSRNQKIITKNTKRS